jgi:hypothetical protein
LEMGTDVEPVVLRVVEPPGHYRPTTVHAGPWHNGERLLHNVMLPPSSAILTLPGKSPILPGLHASLGDVVVCGETGKPLMCGT